MNGERDAACEKLAEWIREARHMVFFGGAGVSTESGIPDFRSEDGLYRMKYPHPPEVMLSHAFFTPVPWQISEARTPLFAISSFCNSQKRIHNHRFS